MEGLAEAARLEEAEGACPLLPACHSSRLDTAAVFHGSWFHRCPLNSTLFFNPRPPEPASLHQQHQAASHPSRLRSQLWRVSSPSLEVLITPKKRFQRFLNLSLLEACYNVGGWAPPSEFPIQLEFAFPTRSPMLLLHLV